MEAKLTDESFMPFGKHKGDKMENVPASYLLWCYDQEWCRGAVRAYIEDNMDVLNSQVKK